MHDENSSVAADEARVDHAILSILLDDHGPPLWAVEEVAREMGDPLATADSLARLYGAGLVHRFEDFVFATRAALSACRLF